MNFVLGNIAPALHNDSVLAVDFALLLFENLIIFKTDTNQITSQLSLVLIMVLV